MLTAKTEMDTNHSQVFTIREFKESDRKFIMATFLKGLYHGDSWFSLIPIQIFMDNYKPALDAILANSNTQVQIACLKDDEDIILGYSILGHNYSTIHWVFVKAAWRNGGIARALTPRYPTTVTHLTALGKSLMSKIETAVFNPFKN